MEHTPTFAGVPVTKRRRWPRVLLVVALALGALVGVGFAAGVITVYDGPKNAGVVIGWECRNIGYEWRGTPGFFADSCG